MIKGLVSPLPDWKCPLCKKKGLSVDKITVICHSREGRWPLKGEKYFICENPACDAVYFSPHGELIKKADVKTRVTFKEKDSPRPLCYCKQVTEEDVLSAIKKGAKTFDEVVEATDIGGGGFCKYTNPYGRCCSRNYIPFIERALKATAPRTGVLVV
jgi:bacterioferritin-associated ferredoxin